MVSGLREENVGNSGLMVKSLIVKFVMLNDMEKYVMHSVAGLKMSL